VCRPKAPRVRIPVSPQINGIFMFKDYVPDREGIFLPSIEVIEHPEKGYICVAAADISSGTLIERCLTIKFSTKTLDYLHEMLGGRTVLHDYNFSQSSKGYSYFAMGYGGIYSHSDDPNAKWVITHHKNDRDTVDIRAIKNIRKGEEITHRYVKGHFRDFLWFDPVD